MDEILQSPRNLANKRLWQPQLWYRDHWRGIPKLTIPKLAMDGGISFVVEPDNAFWHNVFGLDLRRYSCLMNRNCQTMRAGLLIDIAAAIPRGPWNSLNRPPI